MREIQTFMGVWRGARSKRVGARRGRGWRGRLRRRHAELLENRRLLAAEVVISEFMAANGSTLADANGDHPDWIEVRNVSERPVDLGGYALTDDPAHERPWQFPTRVLAAGDAVVVFASSRGVPDGDGNLHADFRLNSEGDYLALLRPDGSVATEFAPEYPPQVRDVSYGISRREESTPLVAPASAAQYLVPGFFDGPALGTRWRDPGFDDARWKPGTASLGYDAQAAIPTNLATKGAATQSSTGFSMNAAAATDGKLDTFSHTADLPDSWWRLRLAADASLGRLVLWNRIDCCAERMSNFRVTVSDSQGKVAWEHDYYTPADGGGFVLQGDALEIDLPAGTRGNTIEVRLLGQNREGNGYLSIAEAQVFEAVGYLGQFQTDVRSEMFDWNSSAYLRIPLEVAAGVSFDELQLSAQYDDGFVAFLNGREIARRNAPESLDWIARATADRASTDALKPERLRIPVAATDLRAGKNVLAIHTLNDRLDSSDFLQSYGLEGIEGVREARAFFPQPTPGQPNGEGVSGFVAAPQFTVARGLYSEPFATRIVGPADATLVYTTDGSAPTLANGRQVLPPVPGSAAMVEVPVATTSTLRAAAFRDGWSASQVATHTYIFPADVVKQPAVIPGLPTTWDGKSESPIKADYQMDPDVVNDPRYQADAVRGLSGIPSVSRVMNPDDLFGAERGIYIHSGERGPAWERATSVEILEKDGRSYQADSGVRIHGYSWRFHAITPKHSFRLEFSDEYGPSKLDYKLFPDSPVDRFDSIVLRAQGGRAWAGEQEPLQTQYIHDAFARDTARDMGKVDGHAAFFHLYLNGVYWGLYHAVERPDAEMGAEYFGGEPEDYDALNRRTSTNEAIDGTLERYNEMIALANKGIATAEDYAKMQQYVDLDNLIDFFLIHQYMTNRDGPEVFESNNQRAIGSRVGDARFRFFVWDMEYSMWNATDRINIDVDVPTSASRVYSALRQYPEFRLRYADRVHQHLFHDGALTPEKAAARWQARADEIYTAVVDESARWGDAKRAKPYTRDKEWLDELNRLKTRYFPQRTAILLKQLTDAGLYPTLEAPQFDRHGGYVTPGYELTMSAPQGEIYYTLDGSDPRRAIDWGAPPVLVPLGATWKYLDDGTDQGTAWRELPFDDGRWKAGPAEFGYGDGDEKTVIHCGPDAPACAVNNQITSYFRHEFQLEDPARFASLLARIRRDDGAIIYLNGVEVARTNMPNGPITFQSLAITAAAETAYTPIRLPASALRAGRNVIAVEIHQRRASDNDVSFDMELMGIYAAAGEPSPAARKYSSAVRIASDAVVKARVLSAGVWSALNEAEFFAGAPADSSNLRVTEVNYHPLRDGDHEFLELANVGMERISLAGVRITEGVEFQFDGSAVRSLEPGQRVVVARNVDAFHARYAPGIAVAGAYSDKLDDGGERLRVIAASGAVIQDFVFDDEAPWPELADGGGATLEVVDVRGDAGDPRNWRTSPLPDGSPGSAAWLPGDANLDGRFDSADLVVVFQANQYEKPASADAPNDAGWSAGDWNRDGFFNSADLVFAMQLGYDLVVTPKGTENTEV